MHENKKWLLFLTLFICFSVILLQYTHVNPQVTSEDLEVSYLFSFDTKTNDKTSGKPRTLAINSLENIYVVIPYAKEIRAYNPNGNYLFSFGKRMEKGKEEKGCFSEPSGIAISNDNAVYVTDLDRDVVLVFGPKGDFLFEFPIFQPVNQPDACAPFIGYNEKQGLLYIPDPCTQRVNVYKSSGEFIVFFGEIGAELGKFGGPANCAFNEQGAIFVVDPGNFRIQQFGPRHEPVLTFGKMGTKKGEFVRPYSIELDKQGRVYISDIVLKNIQVFNQKGDFLKMIQNEQDKELIKQPLGIVISGNRLFIADGEALKIHVFEIK